MIEDGVLIPYQGNYTEYRTRKRPLVLDIPTPLKAKGKEALAPEKAGKNTAGAPARVGGKKGKAKVRTVEDVEKEIEKAEALVRQIEEKLSEAALKADADGLRQFSAEHEQAKARVEELLAEWEELASAAS